jgi:hypothetical protein
MKTEVGLWIDHRQAVIVSLVDQVEEIKRITSDIENHVRYSGASSKGSHDDTTEIRRDSLVLDPASIFKKLNADQRRIAAGHGTPCSYQTQSDLPDGALRLDSLNLIKYSNSTKEA